MGEGIRVSTFKDKKFDLFNGPNRITGVIINGDCVGAENTLITASFLNRISLPKSQANLFSVES